MTNKDEEGTDVWSRNLSDALAQLRRTERIEKRLTEWHLERWLAQYVHLASAGYHQVSKMESRASKAQRKRLRGEKERKLIHCCICKEDEGPSNPLNL